MKPPTSTRRLPFIIAATITLVVAAIAVAVAFNGADSGLPTGVVVPTPTPKATPTPSPTATPSATATPSPSPSLALLSDPCTSATFGSDLGALDAPSNVHVYSTEPAMTIDTSKLYLVTLNTTEGAIDLCLQPSLAPDTVNVIVTLVRNGFYNGIPFHRVCPNSADSSCGGTPPLEIAQVGDPNCIGNVSGTTCGEGGPGFKFDDEPVTAQYTTGCVAMANSGTNTNGSQFFICTGDDSQVLAPDYNLFGIVSSGLSVAQSLKKGDLINTATVQEQS
jgi:cyclophilin family peptidyl-prolyl cis-trans isomerase